MKGTLVMTAPTLSTACNAVAKWEQMGALSSSWRSLMLLAQGKAVKVGEVSTVVLYVMYTTLL